MRFVETENNIAVFDKWLEKNTDAYGRRVFTYARDWANIMEQIFDADTEREHQLKDIISKTSHFCDWDGITGAMYGMAMSILKNCWYYGDLLKDCDGFNVRVQQSDYQKLNGE